MLAGDEVEGAGPAPAQRVHENQTVIPGRDPDLGGTHDAAGGSPIPAGVATLEEFARSLVEIGLIDEAELEFYAADSAEGVLGLSRALVTAGKLTPYQAAAIYQKKSRGLLVGNYVILGKLGQGGMGVVFKARHRRLGRVGALKLLPPSFARDRDAVMRFRREVEAAGKLKHPNLVAAQDADEDRGVHFLVMDYVEGHDLDRMVRDRGPMAVTQAVDCLIQAARGLEAAHAQGIIHRDIKPANLMLDSSGTVRVLDLGLARIVDAANPYGKSTKGRLTQSGMYMGTVDYMAPEQAEDSHRVDHRADIYSLGCTLYYLLTGQEPFMGETVLKKLMAHMERPAPSLRHARRDVPSSLDAAYLSMMAKRPEDRPASMTEVVALLQASKTAPELEKRTEAAPPKSKPELMVFDEQPLKRAGPPRTKAEPSIFARPQQSGGLALGQELNLEDLVMDVRPEHQPTPLPATHRPAPAREQPLKRLTGAQSRGRSRRRGPVVLVVGATAVLAAGIVGVVLLSRPGTVNNATVREAGNVPVLPKDGGAADQANDHPAPPPSPPIEVAKATPAVKTTPSKPSSTEVPRRENGPPTLDAQPGAILVLGIDRGPSPAHDKVIYAWDGGTGRPALLCKWQSKMATTVDAFAVGRDGRRYYTDLGNFVFEADQGGEKAIFQSTLRYPIRDIALDDDDNVYFSVSPDDDTTVTICRLRPASGGTAAAALLHCRVPVRELRPSPSGRSGFWTGYFAFGRTADGHIDTDTVYLSSGTLRSGAIFRMTRNAGAWSKPTPVFQNELGIYNLVFASPTIAYYRSGDQVFRLTDLKKAEPVLTLSEISSKSSISVMPVRDRRRTALRTSAPAPTSSTSVMPVMLGTRAILTRLDEPVPMQFPNATPLLDVLSHIRQATKVGNDAGIPVYLDPLGLQEVERTWTSTVTINVDKTPLKIALQQVLGQVRLAYVVKDDVIFISSPGRVDREKRESSVVATDGSPKTKAVLARLSAAVPMPFPNQTPLIDVVRHVQQATKRGDAPDIRVDFNPRGLQEAQKTMTSTVSIDLEGVPLKTTLRLLLAQLDLAYAVKDGAVEISSTKAIRNFRALSESRAQGND